MKLQELAYVIGDDGGMHRHMDDALKNMDHHSKHHKNAEVRDLCKQALTCIKKHMQHPASLYDDPHTFLKVLQSFKGTPDKDKILHGVNTLGSYTQSDSD